MPSLLLHTMSVRGKLTGMVYLDEEFIQKVYRSCRLKRKQLPDPTLSEDVAQEMLLSYLEGKADHKLRDHARIDAIRRLLGDSRQKVKRATCDHTALKRAVAQPEPSSPFTVNILSRIHGVDRAVIVGIYWLGMTLPELSDALGLAPENVCRKHTATLRRLRQCVT